MRTLVALLALVGLGLGPGCGTSDRRGGGGTTGGGGRVCDPGAVQACPCLGGEQGVQGCADDGARWEACECAASEGEGG